MANNNKISEVTKKKYEEEANLRWLTMYKKTVVGLAALAEQHAEGCETGWLAMMYGLEDLAETMDIDIKDREERLNKEE